ncbi:MAG: class I SAM-dependent methyltransferase [Candidatus Paceibacterota bacterium]|jgi:SAM-dependent methyltransferase
MDILDLEKNTLAFDYFWYKARRNLISVIFSKYDIKNMSILEVGCGAGSQLESLSRNNNNVVGSDINHKALAEEEKRGFSVFYQDIEERVTKGEQYDVVCAFDVLEHIKNDEVAIQNIYALLKPNGLFVFTVPTFQFLFSGHDNYLQHYRRYAKREIVQKLLKNDFEIVELNYWNFILFPLMAVKRLLSKHKYPKSDVDNLPKPLNQLLYGILLFENKLIEKGVQLPFGLSVIGVAKKR